MVDYGYYVFFLSNCPDIIIKILQKRHGACVSDSFQDRSDLVKVEFPCLHPQCRVFDGKVHPNDRMSPAGSARKESIVSLLWEKHQCRGLEPFFVAEKEGAQAPQFA